MVDTIYFVRVSKTTTALTYDIVPIPVINEHPDWFEVKPLRHVGASERIVEKVFFSDAVIKNSRPGWFNGKGYALNQDDAEDLLENIKEKLLALNKKWIIQCGIAIDELNSIKTAG